MQYTERNNGNDDTLAVVFCSAACDVVNDYLGYDPEQKTYRLIINGDDSNQLIVPVKPIKEITAVSIAGVAINPDTIFTQDNYLFNSTGIFPAGIGNVIVECIAGHESVPGIIKMTALRIAGVLAAEENGNIGIQSKSFGDAGSRVFLNSRFDRYLETVEKYRIYRM